MILEVRSYYKKYIDSYTGDSLDGDELVWLIEWFVLAFRSSILREQWASRTEVNLQQAVRRLMRFEDQNVGNIGLCGVLASSKPTIDGIT